MRGLLGCSASLGTGVGHDSPDAAASQSAVTPFLNAAMLFSQFTVQTVGQRDKAFRIGPQCQQATCLARCAGSYRGCLQESDCV